MGQSQAHQGQGDASGEPELRGSTDRAASLRYGQNADASSGRGAERGARIPAPEAGDFASAQRPKGGRGPGSRIALRNWRISTRLVSLLALPVIAATTLGAFRIEDEWRNLQQLENMKLLTDMTEEATELADMLQQERDKSAGLIVAGNPKHADIVDARDETEQALDAFRSSAEEIDTTGGESLAGVNNSLTSVIEKLNKINSIRQTAYSDDTGGSAQTVKAYGELIESLVSLSQDMALATSNPDMIAKTRALATFSAAKEYASVQQAIISATLAETPRDDFAEADRLEASSAQESETSSLKLFAHLYSGRIGLTDLMRSLDGGNASVQQADTFAKNLVSNPDSLKGTDMSYRHWYELDSVKIEEMKKIEQHLLQEMEQTARDLRSEAQQSAIFSAILILLVLLISLAGAFVVARSMVRSLRRLQDTAQTVAQKRLPELVKQLSEADPQDVDTSVETVGIQSRDEIGKVASAFDDVHREAVRLAAEQALLRGNVNAMFTNLSRRSQGLIQRQLSLISELESREADPDQLENLFKLDHLATRMRRNGENLLVLAGEEPGRRWTRPVPLVDVLRAAASEVEQYERIELSAVPATQVAGRVVNDLVHLLAELLENATSFSSPQTKVKVTGHALPDGRVLVEIHDTGIGLSPEDLAAINERLANPPTVDVSVSRRMGLFVVGRLSLRHGIRIQLRPSDSGGTTALVMLPVDVTQHGGGAGGKQPAGAGAAGGQQPSGPGGPVGAGRAGAMSRLGAMQERGQVGSSAGRPALPSRDLNSPPPQRPGLPSRPGPDTGSRNPADVQHAGAGTGAGPGDTAPQEAVRERPRQHEDAESTGQFARPGMSPESTGQFTRPNLPGRPPAGRGGPGGTQPPEATPAYGTPGSPRNPQAPVPGQSAAYGNPQDTGEHPLPPPQRPEPRRPQPSAYGGPQDTGEHRVPPPPPEPRQPQGPAYGGPQDTGEHPVPPQRNGGGGPLGGDPVSARGDERTPIYESMESDWFRGTRSRGVPPVGPTGASKRPVPPPPSVPPDAQQPPTPQPPEQPPPAQPAPAAAPQAWRPSPNDDRWRQAEQVRRPAAGGVTTSGLPRRVPRANLVAGTAEQQVAHNTGTEVSRAPDDVRGRLTNLRRGIQQGRQAGGTLGGNGFGPTYQQER